MQKENDFVVNAVSWDPTDPGPGPGSATSLLMSIVNEHAQVGFSG